MLPTKKSRKCHCLLLFWCENIKTNQNHPVLSKQLLMHLCAGLFSSSYVRSDFLYFFIFYSSSNLLQSCFHHDVKEADWLWNAVRFKAADLNIFLSEAAEIGEQRIQTWNVSNAAAARGCVLSASSMIYHKIAWKKSKLSTFFFPQTRWIRCFDFPCSACSWWELLAL